MPDPTNNQSQLRSLLAQYLTQETTQYYPDIDWLYYYQAHDAEMSPRGAIFVDRISRDDQYPFNVEQARKTYQIHLRLKVSKITLEELLSSLESWESELNDKIAKKLQIDGHNDYFKGIHLDPRQPSVLEVDKNQDEGAKGNLHLFWVWSDDDIVSKQQEW